jgi:hypothetical protein
MAEGVNELFSWIIRLLFAAVQHQSAEIMLGVIKRCALPPVRRERIFAVMAVRQRTDKAIWGA